MTNGLTNGWHLDKRVSVGHIVTTACALLAAVVFFLQLQARVDANQRAIQTEETARKTMDTRLQNRLSRMEERNRETYKEIKAYLVRLEHKVDALTMSSEYRRQ